MTSDIADLDEVLRLLTRRAREGAVTAATALLRHYSAIEQQQEATVVDPAELDAWQDED